MDSETSQKVFSYEQFSRKMVFVLHQIFISLFPALTRVADLVSPESYIFGRGWSVFLDLLESHSYRYCGVEIENFFMGRVRIAVVK